MKKYELQHEKDSKRATELCQQVTEQAESTNFNEMSLQELEQELVEIYRMKGEIDHLVHRYKESLQQDNEKRQRLHP